MDRTVMPPPPTPRVPHAPGLAAVPRPMIWITTSDQGSRFPKLLASDIQSATPTNASSSGRPFPVGGGGRLPLTPHPDVVQPEAASENLDTPVLSHYGFWVRGQRQMLTPTTPSILSGFTTPTPFRPPSKLDFSKS